MIKDYNLADQALAGLSAPKIGLVTYESTPSLCPSVARKVNQGEKVRLTSFSRERIQRQYNILRKATRYTVDHAMVRHAQLVSMAVTAEELSTMIESAIPPNIPMWIEWNEHVRQDAIGEHYKSTDNNILLRKWEDGRESCADYVGYTIEEIDYPFIGTGEEDHYAFTPVFPVAHNEAKLSLSRQPIVFTPESFVLSQEAWSEKDERALLKDFLSEYTEEEFQDFTKQHEHKVATSLGGGWSHEQVWDFIRRYKFAQRIHIVQSASIDWLIPRHSLTDDHYDAEDHDAISNVMCSSFSTGDMRFLICLLHTLNYDWVIRTPRIMTGKSGIRYGKRTKFNSHTVLEIDLPKKNGVTITPDEFLEEVQGMKRLHDVRGHFRKLHDGRRVWVKSHKRGNKELGTITKDYVLTNKSKGEC